MVLSPKYTRSFSHNLKTYGDEFLLHHLILAPFYGLTHFVGVACRILHNKRVRRQRLNVNDESYDYSEEHIHSGSL